MTVASARHILVKTQDQAQDLKTKLPKALILVSWQRNFLIAHQAKKAATSVSFAPAKW